MIPAPGTHLAAGSVRAGTHLQVFDTEAVAIPSERAAETACAVWQEREDFMSTAHRPRHGGRQARREGAQMTNRPPDSLSSTRAAARIAGQIIRRAPLSGYQKGYQRPS